MRILKIIAVCILFTAIGRFSTIKTAGRDAVQNFEAKMAVLMGDRKIQEVPLRHQTEFRQAQTVKQDAGEASAIFINRDVSPRSYYCDWKPADR